MRFGFCEGGEDFAFDFLSILGVLYEVVAVDFEVEFELALKIPVVCKLLCLFDPLEFGEEFLIERREDLDTHKALEHEDGVEEVILELEDGVENLIEFLPCLVDAEREHEQLGVELDPTSHLVDGVPDRVVGCELGDIGFMVFEFGVEFPDEEGYVEMVDVVGNDTADHSNQSGQQSLVILLATGDIGVLKVKQIFLEEVIKQCKLAVDEPFRKCDAFRQ